jgi:hypothetical protein
MMAYQVNCFIYQSCAGDEEFGMKKLKPGGIMSFWYWVRAKNPAR